MTPAKAELLTHLRTVAAQFTEQAEMLESGRISLHHNNEDISVKWALHQRHKAEELRQLIEQHDPDGVTITQRQG